ncbi:hypothetical protein NEOLEDRAFT_143390 [Neolentinus lepideus HHB14362 ss-1]|uniref:Uncharacterized protein n=1 Tax=Neolentinus lepideus HHB14362 ss-1 TaxID=1314782 RepID=A0A165U0I8_9AGAM|nr:hypothetical protein NEOLEDRAFT_143390 [Neolentinus lepideus HHB14362 ss-1]
MATRVDPPRHVAENDHFRFPAQPARFIPLNSTLLKTAWLTPELQLGLGSSVHGEHSVRTGSLLATCLGLYSALMARTFAPQFTGGEQSLNPGLLGSSRFKCLVELGEAVCLSCGEEKVNPRLSNLQFSPPLPLPLPLNFVSIAEVRCIRLSILLSHAVTGTQIPVLLVLNSVFTRAREGLHGNRSSTLSLWCLHFNALVPGQAAISQAFWLF